MHKDDGRDDAFYLPVMMPAFTAFTPCLFITQRLPFASDDGDDGDDAICQHLATMR
jgi:hypothetical protein